MNERRETDTAEYELRFRSLFEPGRAYAFPCDAEGNPRTDVMSDGTIQRLKRIRERVGLDFEMPRITRVR